MNVRGLLAVLDVRAAVVWWFRDADAPPGEPVMVRTEIGTRPLDGATTCTLLDPPPKRGRVVYHAVLPAGADRYRVAGVLRVMCREARRWTPDAEWACYVTAGNVVGYLGRDSRYPIAVEAEMPRRPTRSLPAGLQRAASRPKA